MRRFFASLFFVMLPAVAFGYGAIPCPAASPDDIPIILTGQSQAGSYGDVAFQPPLSGTPTGDIQIWFGTSTCYPLNDALAGFPAPWMPGSGGSIATRVSQLLRDQYPNWPGRLVIVNIAQNGVPITNWGQSGPNYPRIQTAVNILSAGGWTPKALIFMGGESDAMAGQSYAMVKAALDSMVDGRRTAGDTYPIFIGLSTTCRAVPDPGQPNGIASAGIDFELLTNAETREYQAASLRMHQQSEVQRAIWTMNDPSRNVSVGPNFDLISAFNRWDRCHDANYAQWLSAQMLIDTLQRAGLTP